MSYPPILPALISHRILFIFHEDMAKDHSKYLIKSYQYWDVKVHENQGYLGRCVIWCKRTDVEDLTDVTGPEMEEFLFLLRELRKASSQCFAPDWFNYAFLGNVVRHLHAHFIPRYAQKKTFMGTVFEDKFYGDNYRTDHEFITSEDVLLEVRKLMQNNLR